MQICEKDKFMLIVISKKPMESLWIHRKIIIIKSTISNSKIKATKIDRSNKNIIYFIRKFLP